jgi:hypothetical protein
MTRHKLPALPTPQRFIFVRILTILNLMIPAGSGISAIDSKESTMTLFFKFRGVYITV